MRIGELAAAAGTSPKTLRFYESVGLFPPPRRTLNGYRDYPENAIYRLDFIRRGQSAGLSLVRIGEILRIRDAGQAPCAHVDTLLATRLDEIDQLIADLLQLRQTVADLQSASRTVDPATCQAETICRYL